MVGMHGLDEFRCYVNSFSFIGFRSHMHHTYTCSTLSTHMIIIFSHLVYFAYTSNLPFWQGMEYSLLALC